MGTTRPNALGFHAGLAQLKQAKRPLLYWGYLQAVITEEVGYFLWEDNNWVLGITIISHLSVGTFSTPGIGRGAMGSPKRKISWYKFSSGWYQQSNEKNRSPQSLLHLPSKTCHRGVEDFQQSEFSPSLIASATYVDIVAQMMLTTCRMTHSKKGEKRKNNFQLF